MGTRRFSGFRFQFSSCDVLGLINGVLGSWCLFGRRVNLSTQLAGQLPRFNVFKSFNLPNGSFTLFIMHGIQQASRTRLN